MRNVRYLFLLSVFFIGCKTVKQADFIVYNANSLSIPALEPQADLDNLLGHISYGDIKITGDVEYTKMTPHFAKVDYDLKVEYIPEKRAYDILKLFAYEVKNNINNTDTIPHGSIQLELIDFKEKRSFWWTFLSIWTACVPNLIGSPLTSISTQLEIQVLILNAKNNIIGKYTAKGHGRSYIAMYWGYGEDAWRKSNIIAFKEAMASIKTQIKDDSKDLNNKLEIK